MHWLLFYLVLCKTRSNSEEFTEQIHKIMLLSLKRNTVYNLYMSDQHIYLLNFIFLQCSKTVLWTPP